MGLLLIALAIIATVTFVFGAHDIVVTGRYRQGALWMGVYVIAFGLAMLLVVRRS